MIKSTSVLSTTEKYTNIPMVQVFSIVVSLSFAFLLKDLHLGAK